jgi:hypothetical protein
MSQLCRTAAFARLAGAILSDLPRFHAVYNAAVHEYRKANRIRSRNHPVPDLAADGDWLEAPFWAWRAGGDRRRPLFARRVGGGIALRAGDDVWPALSAAKLSEEWPSLEAAGLKVRTRALTTTLFARLVLADLFVHGLGGGLYDRLTDAIAAKFFGAAPPAYLVLTGTLRLPLPAFARSKDSPGRRERDLLWNPQRYVGDKNSDSAAQRAALIASAPNTRRGRRDRYHALRANLERLMPEVTGQLHEAREAVTKDDDRAAANRLLRSRDYSFVLHSERALRDFTTSVEA